MTLTLVQPTPTERAEVYYVADEREQGQFTDRPDRSNLDDTHSASSDRRSGIVDRRIDAAGMPERPSDAAIVVSQKTISLTFVLLLFGFQIGATVASHFALSHSFDDFKTEIRGRLDKASTEASDANVASKVTAKEFEKEQRRNEIRDTEMDQWRGFFKAIAMLQQQGGGKVTIQIPERPKEPKDKDGGNKP